jgi:hypothetical protein
MEEAEDEVDERPPSCERIENNDPERGSRAELMHGVTPPAVVDEKHRTFTNYQATGGCKVP